MTLNTAILGVIYHVNINPHTIHEVPSFIHSKDTMGLQNLQVSAVIDKPARRAASRQTCCKQLRWMLSVINLQPN